ncbi:hypothetical protein ISCGN_026810 [Ixodes scapularis]
MNDIGEGKRCLVEGEDVLECGHAIECSVAPEPTANSVRIVAYVLQSSARFKSMLRALRVRSGRAFSLKRSANETYVKYKNKCDELQKHLQVPLFDENEAPFAPTIDEMKQAESIFVSDRNHTISFIKSAVRPHQYPDHDLPEVAVLGASNVGKSSLLQAVFHKVPDVCVKVSKKPGHTKTLNFYGVGKKFGLVDMPGYGFRQPKEFSAFASEFLTSRTNLKRTFLVLDGHVGFRNFDQDAVEMFEQLKVPYGVYEKS